MMKLPVFLLVLGILCPFLPAADSLPALGDGKVPPSFEELWKGYDPRAEPLDTEVLKEWEEDGAVLRVLRYRAGVFKDKKAMIAAIYGFPKGGTKLPGLLNIHGGGQFADYRSVLTNAKRGYATITIAWAGRLSAPGYQVGPKEVKLFWEGKTDDPAYRVTTDWGALDAYHAPSRHGKDAFVSLPAGEAWTLDPVKSPRNNSWFLCTLAARRALTFLEQQPEVDAAKLGVYGHSMGGKLTVLTAGSDSRVKAAAPSCGGISDRYNADPLHRETVGDSPALKHIACPVVFLSPANDFHGRINDLPAATGELGQNPWRVVCSPHLNHRDVPEGEVATQLWFDQYLKGSFTWPATPQMTVLLKNPNGVPVVHVVPDAGKPVLGVDVYYTQQGSEGEGEARENRMNRFWHHAATTQRGNAWTADLPVFSTEMPLWVYAHVTCGLDRPVSGAGYYYGSYSADQFTVSSLVQLFQPAQLKEAGVKNTLQPTPLIETFGGEWKKQWYWYGSAPWEYRTHKVYHPQWAAPEGARLALDVRAGQPNTFSLGLDDYACPVEIKGGNTWESLTFAPSDFKDATEAPLPGWKNLRELRLIHAEHLRSGKGEKQITRLVGKAWKGPEPQFRNLRWITDAVVDIKSLMPKEEDATSMWWRDGFPGKTENATWCRIVRTGRYWFMFDTDTMAVARLGSTEIPVNEVPSARLDLQLMVDGKRYRCVQGGGWSRFTGPRLIESGRFLQRADVTGLVFKAEDGSQLNVDARFEAAAWPDQLGMTLAARPGLRPIQAGEASFGRVSGGFGLDGKTELTLPPAEAEVPETFALEFWAFVPTDFQAGRAFPWLVCKGFHEEADGNFGIMVHSGAVPEATLNIGGGRDNMHRARAETRHALRLDQWNHLALSYDGKTLRLAVNGSEAIAREVGKKYIPGTGALTFGNRGDNAGNGAYRFIGVVDQIRLFGQLLEENQLQHLYRNPEAGLPHLKPNWEKTFRADVPASMAQPGERWKSASIDLKIANEKGELSARWDLPAGQTWGNQEWREAGLSFDPVAFRRLPETSDIRIRAAELVTGENRPVTFEPATGWHRIHLSGIEPVPPPGGASPSNDALERVRLFLSNPGKEEKIARLMFEKDSRGILQRIGAPITGISAVLRDREGNPTGIPVQLSKNWHFHPEDRSVHSGQWFHGISQLRLPPGTGTELELTLAYGHWGGVAAASHSQLSLIGWGGSQRWDQSALGSWGESICYSPEQNEAGCTITDVRPLMVASMNNNEPWNWTVNVGGGDFLRIFDPAGKHLQRSGVTADYLRQGPCLAEALYTGGLRNANVHHTQTVSISRGDDLVRGTYRISMRVNEALDFSRFAIFQIGSDNYATTRERKLAVGDENGLVREWDAQWGGNAYRGEAIECSGRIPWASLHETEGNGRHGEPGAWANRGFVIREWKAKLGGKDCRPWIAEWGLDRPGDFKTSLLEIVPPPGIKRLEAGDFVETTVEHLIIPRDAADYYGPSESFRSALKKDGNTWRMIHRETAQGDRRVAIATGNLERLYPDIRVAAINNRAEFSLEGGLGYVPVTFTHLASHRGYALTIYGKKVDQSVHGNDFWQADYDAKSGLWSRTYNIPAAPGKARVVRLEPEPH